MMKFLRSQSQTVLVIVFAVIGLGFLFYGSSGTLLNSPAGQGNSDTGEINGTNVNYADLQNAVRDTRNSIILNGQGEQLKQPGASAQVAQEAWRQMLLMAEADKLHINPTDQQVVDYIRNQPPFPGPQDRPIQPGCLHGTVLQMTPGHAQCAAQPGARSVAGNGGCFCAGHPQ